MVRPAAPATFAVLFCLSGLARAQTPPPAQRAQIYSPYETETIAAALARFHEKIDPTPEGKIVERVDVVTLDVIEQRNPLPNWLNVFHATTRPSIVRRELLVQEGDPYRQGLVDETIRNLRQLPPLSLVLVVATAGTRPDRVGLLVITKDVWSLRANWDVNLTSGGLELLEIDPEERNLFGRHQDVSASFVLQPSAYTVGAGYTVERLGSSRVAVVTDANVMINRASGSPEGSFGSLVAGQPLYSALTEWAWDGTTSWQDIEVRRYVNAQPSVFLDTTTGMSVPFQYRERQFVELLNVRRSFGSETKHDLLFGLGINRTEFSTDFPGASPRTVADFEATYVPNSDTRVGPTIQYETYEKRYVRVIDFDTLALQEDYRLGHDIVVKLSPSFRALGASENLLSIGASAQYTFALRDGLFRLGVATLTEPTIDSIFEAYVQPYAYLVTPSIAGVGRFVFDASATDTWRNSLNVTYSLGGGDRLRGYPTNYFVGQNLVSYNLEFRSRPVEILSCQLAAVGFFDAGDATKSWSTFQPYQSVGVGIRALFPQLDRAVFRADLGVPLERPFNVSTNASVPPVGFFFSFGQALGAPSDAPVPVLPTEQVENPDQGD